MSEETLVKGAVLHGTYELVDLLGRGGMGAVWRARHLRLPRPVAIKVLHEHAYESTEILQRFRREAEITSQLGHPHIVEVSDFNVLEDGRAYLVMELLEGVSLRQRLRDGRPFSLDDVGLLLGQVSSALSRAHRAGVVHRDLKPENIFLVDHDGTGPFAKVLDFGISKMQGAETVLTQGASLMGTPRYMSPEQARGDNASVDGRADQFSVGAIAYECLSGRPAFAGSSVTQVLLQVLEEDPEPLGRVAPEVPPALAAVVHRALGKERDGRFPSMDAFREALGLALGSEVGTFTPTPRGARADTEPEAYEDTVLRPGADSEGTRREPGEGRRKVPIWAVLAVLALGLAAGVVVSLSILGPDPIDIVAVDAGLSHSRAEDASRAERVDAGSALDAPAAPDGGVDSSAADAGGVRRRPVRPAPVPPRLAGARRALRKKDWNEAIRLARRSLREEGDPRAHGALAHAYCGKRDLGSANAALRSTPSRERAAVRRACARLGVELLP